MRKYDDHVLSQNVSAADGKFQMKDHNFVSNILVQGTFFN